MTVQTNAPTGLRKFRLILAIVGMVVASLVMSVASVSAGTENPTFIDSDNPTCGDLGFDNEVKIDSGDFDGTSPDTFSGSVGDPPFDYTITIAYNAGLTEFDFSAADPPVMALVVKAGNGAFLWDYSPGGATSGSVYTPDNDGGQQAQLSHLSICFGEPSETPTPTPEGSQAGGTGTPAPSVPDTATSLPGMAGPLATVAFGLILLGSLGALAYANVSAVRRRS